MKKDGTLGKLLGHSDLIAAVGVVLATLAVKTRRLGPSIVTHGAFNAVVVLWYTVSR